MNKPLLNYCLVTQNLASIIEDSDYDSDRFPDVSDISGEVIFTPNIANGKAYQLFDSDGKSYTVPVSRIQAKIINGEISHEGSPGVYLFAAGPGSNPDKITYTVEYRNLRSGELSFALSPLKFEAIPGGEVDLTMVTPVIGATPAGVIRGPAATIISQEVLPNGDVKVEFSDGTVVTIPSAEDGETPHIKDGNWWIGNHDTGVIADGVDLVRSSIAEQISDLESTIKEAESFIAAHRTHVDHQVSTIDTAFTESIPPYLQPDSNTGLQAIYGRGVNVKTFGAVGDGEADDTAAIQSAIRSGQPLYWGDSNAVYRTTNTVSANISHPITWRSDGAKILFDPLEPVRRVLYITINNEPVSIDGPLSIDANRKAFDGFTLESADTQVDADITGLEVSNTYRSSNLYTGGNGISINGAFSTLTLNRPIVRSVTMAPGTAESEPHGVAGITVAAFDSMRYARDIQINAPFVDGVYDEDITNHNSQNGIRIYGPSDTSENSTSFPMKFVINGGTISNAGGRAVKSQCEWGTIDGLTIIRDMDRTIGKSDIDFQRGGGQITNLSVKYAGNSAKSVIKFSGAVSAEKTVPHGSVSGMKVEISGGQVPDTIVNLLQDAAMESYVVVTDAEVVGEQPQYFLTLNGTEGTITHASLNSIYAAPETSLVCGTGGTSQGWTGSVGAVNVTNTGSNKKPFFQSSSGPRANPQISATNVHGFSGAGIETTAILKTVEATTSGWNDLILESGLGSVYSPSYFRLPAGTYRITYIGRTEPFERYTQKTGRGTLTPANGLVTEIIRFDAADYFRVPGSMTDLTVMFEFLF